MAIVSIKEIKQADESWKGGAGYNEASAKLGQLFDDASSNLTLNYLRTLGLGNKYNSQYPFEASIMKRIVDALTVVYSAPATRVLEIDGTELADDDPFSTAMVEAFERSCYDLLWQRIDALRNLYRTAIIEWTEDPSQGCVGAIVYGPHQVYRMPSMTAPHAIEYDRAVLLQIRQGESQRDNLYRLWLKDGENFKCFIVDESGEPINDQPFGASGKTPYSDMLPLQIITDEHPTFRAWLPIPSSRISWALGINGQIADLALLVQHEAHTTKVLKSDSSGAVPSEVGPDKIIKIPQDGDFLSLASSPHIAESATVLEQMLRLFSVSEYLQGDLFDSSKTPHTGQAMRVAQHPLAQRRARQIQLIPSQERRAWTIYSRIHNTFCGGWGVPLLPESAGIRVTPNNSWQPVDLTEKQNTVFKNLAGGFLSRISATQELFGLTRHQAISHLERVARDNEIFALTEFQNPGAMVDDGASAALGPDSATKTPGAFNPDIPTSTEGASLTDAVAPVDVA